MNCLAVALIRCADSTPALARVLGQTLLRRAMVIATRQIMTPYSLTINLRRQVFVGAAAL
jgi:Na+-transporting NADH:ubiquinone oxidoreductase subunit NqrD